jgi:uncharacterized repeat protein (TIGR03803 family)
MDEYGGITRSRGRHMRKAIVTGTIFLLSFIFLLGALPLKAQAVWTMDWSYGFSTSTTTDDGQIPSAGLIMDGSGNLYGTTTIGGGNNDYGTVFKISSDGTTYNILHRFSGPTDEGSTPNAGLIMDVAGNLYGTTYTGGSGDCPTGCGTVFVLDSDNTLTTLYNFNGSDGRGPRGG